MLQGVDMLADAVAVTMGPKVSHWEMFRIASQCKFVYYRHHATNSVAVSHISESGCMDTLWHYFFFFLGIMVLLHVCCHTHAAACNVTVTHIQILL